MRYSKDFYWLAHYIFDIYKDNSKNKNRKVLKTLGATAFLVEITFKAFATLYLFAILLCITYPAYEYYFAHQLVTFFPYKIPGIDTETLGGYITTMIFQFIGLSLGYFGLTASDSFFCMIVMNIPLMKHLIQIDVKQLNCLLNEEKPSAHAIKFKLRNIIMIYMEMKK